MPLRMSLYYHFLSEFGDKSFLFSLPFRGHHNCLHFLCQVLLSTVLTEIVKRSVKWHVNELMRCVFTSCHLSLHYQHTLFWCQLSQHFGVPPNWLFHRRLFALIILQDKCCFIHLFIPFVWKCTGTQCHTNTIQHKSYNEQSSTVNNWSWIIKNNQLYQTALGRSPT